MASTIKKGDRFQFTMPREVYEMMKPTNPALEQSIEGVALADAYIKDGLTLFRAELSNKTQTILRVEDVIIIE